jgi:hypothetical protein
VKIERAFAGTDGAYTIAAAPAMPFDVLRGRLQLLGLSDRNIRQLERNDKFMHSQFRNPQIAWLFFSVPELFDEHVSRAAQCQIDEEANPKVISKALKRGLVDLGHQEKVTGLILQQETIIINWIEEESARNKHASWMDTLHYVRDKYCLALTKGWVNYFFLRHQDPVSQNTSRS